ncbi:rhamnogalacturonan acetylesterase [Labilibaculum sp. K2S]|uniref:rhamnogalacturonan acetylesterase n=1 Tax=Labilibaculum sp. K2S TaxID=3056386 RepID=UPI0025A43C9C|nr:rhamnogalacturonan acetylesterase [Labilibaculum sp. K2S]MDM8161784.1 rhamnogalacturonan acetylesterase [Labilibaculum sp. K2S]
MKNYLILLGIVLLLISCSDTQTHTVFLAGDSTMAEKKADKYPETGWGMKLNQFFTEKMTVENHAKNGRSTRTFIEEGRWDSLVSKVGKGDYVFIQFGHNDQSKQKIDRYTSPDDFYKNLSRFVDDVRVKKGIPVLLTPLMRRRFDENGVFYDVHGEYPDVIRKVAADKKVVLLDVHKSSGDLLAKLGEEKSRALFLIAQPGVWENYPDGSNDNTHFNEYGAQEMARLVVSALKDTELELKKELKDEQ